MFPLIERLDSMRNYNSDLFEKIIECVENYYFNYSAAPTAKEIADILGKPKSTIYRYIDKLKENGKLSYTAYSGVTTDFTEKMDTESVSVALVGSIVCGKPILAEQNITEIIKMPKSFLGEGNFFILTAEGSSMINAGINDGDKVIIRQQSTAEEGQIVVALIDDETTLKRFYKDAKNKRYRLHPENEEYDDIYVDELEIQGVAVGAYKELV